MVGGVTSFSAQPHSSVRSLCQFVGMERGLRSEGHVVEGVMFWWLRPLADKAKDYNSQQL